MSEATDSESKKKSKKKLEEIVREVLNVGPTIDVKTLEAKNEPSWDSLRHVALCLRIQNDFGVRFDGSELVKMRSYAEIERTLFFHLGKA